MSTLLAQTPPQPLKAESDLLHYFESFAKPRECMRVGLEAEFFAVDRKTGGSLPYEGPSGIEALLKALAGAFKYEIIREGSSVIALKKESQMVTLEPGGQIELSGSPVRNVFDVEAQMRGFLGELHSLKENFPGVAFLAAGSQPFSRLDEVAWVPKRRYEIMAEYLGRRGRLAHSMMKLTATNQINFDYLSEEHAMASLRVIFGITPVVSALFANSPFTEGAPNGLLSRRQAIWRETDPDRTGILYSFLRENKKFEDYLNYVLDMPMIFIVRDNRWIPLGGIPFRSFLRNGFEGFRATLGDFELHLSTAFPEARLKQYLEIRGMDGQLPHLIPALAAFWKGILYDPETREKAWELVSGASLEERKRLEEEVPELGMRARLGKTPVMELAGRLVDLSCSSLARQAGEQERDECLFLDRIRKEILYPGKTPAETLLERWRGELEQDPVRLIRALEI